MDMQKQTKLRTGYIYFTSILLFFQFADKQNKLQGE